ncbi:hypothetical protein CTI12_AA308320 [Artemisia annua]|uniref:Uncharacterized protein n=1 Tax=Artemisia annua TaxID=35608 RepID=A0A2U1N063_ARTAN|nr:hypothetical protein CTI12_AA308320 [Artemisia annua]
MVWAVAVSQVWLTVEMWKRSRSNDGGESRQMALGTRWLMLAGIVACKQQSSKGIMDNRADLKLLECNSRLVDGGGRTNMGRIGVVVKMRMMEELNKVYFV